MEPVTVDGIINFVQENKFLYNKNDKNLQYPYHLLVVTCHLLQLNYRMTYHIYIWHTSYGRWLTTFNSDIRCIVEQALLVINTASDRHSVAVLRQHRYVRGAMILETGADEWTVVLRILPCPVVTYFSAYLACEVFRSEIFRYLQRKNDQDTAVEPTNN